MGLGFGFRVRVSVRVRVTVTPRGLILMTFSFLSRSWAEQVPRPFSTHYNPYTQTVEVIENKEQVASIVGELKSQVDSLQSVLKSMN